MPYYSSNTRPRRVFAADSSDALTETEELSPVTRPRRVLQPSIDEIGSEALRETPQVEIQPDYSSSVSLKELPKPPLTRRIEQPKTEMPVIGRPQVGKTEAPSVGRPQAAATEKPASIPYSLKSSERLFNPPSFSPASVEAALHSRTLGERAESASSTEGLKPFERRNRAQTLAEGEAEQRKIRARGAQPPSRGQQIAVGTLEQQENRAKGTAGKTAQRIVPIAQKPGLQSAGEDPMGKFAETPELLDRSRLMQPEGSTDAAEALAESLAYAYTDPKTIGMTAATMGLGGAAAAVGSKALPYVGKPLARVLGASVTGAGAGAAGQTAEELAQGRFLEDPIGSLGRIGKQAALTAPSFGLPGVVSAGKGLGNIPQWIQRGALGTAVGLGEGAARDETFEEATPNALITGALSAGAVPDIQAPRVPPRLGSPPDAAAPRASFAEKPGTLAELYRQGEGLNYITADSRIGDPNLTIGRDPYGRDPYPPDPNITTRSAPAAVEPPPSPPSSSDFLRGLNELTRRRESLVPGVKPVRGYKVLGKKESPTRLLPPSSIQGESRQTTDLAPSLQGESRQTEGMQKREILSARPERMQGESRQTGGMEPIAVESRQTAPVGKYEVLSAMPPSPPPPIPPRLVLPSYQARQTAPMTARLEPPPAPAKEYLPGARVARDFGATPSKALPNKMAEAQSRAYKRFQETIGSIKGKYPEVKGKTEAELTEFERRDVKYRENEIKKAREDYRQVIGKITEQGPDLTARAPAKPAPPRMDVSAPQTTPASEAISFRKPTESFAAKPAQTKDVQFIGEQPSGASDFPDRIARYLGKEAPAPPKIEPPAPAAKSVYPPMYKGDNAITEPLAGKQANRVPPRLQGTAPKGIELEGGLPKATSDNPFPENSFPEGHVFQNVDPRLLEPDPANLQFKQNVNKKGVTPALSNVKNWNRDAAGVVSVWRDPATGKVRPVAGHHRHELAVRMLEQGKPVKGFDIKFIKAENAKKAREIGALINMAEGSASTKATDIAGVMRESGFSAKEFEERGISLDDAKVKDAISLSKLDNGLWDRTRNGFLAENRAVEIGRAFPDSPDLQWQLYNTVEGKATSAEQIREIADLMKGAPIVEDVQAGLFGDISSKQSLLREMGGLSSYIKNQLGSDKRFFSKIGSEKAAERAGKAGNILNAAENRRIAEESDQALGFFERLKASEGPINKALQEGAVKIKEGQDAGKVRADAYEKIAVAIRTEIDASFSGRKSGDVGSGSLAPKGSEGQAGLFEGENIRPADGVKSGGFSAKARDLAAKWQKDVEDYKEQSKKERRAGFEPIDIEIAAKALGIKILRGAANVADFIKDLRSRFSRLDQQDLDQIESRAKEMFAAEGMQARVPRLKAEGGQRELFGKPTGKIAAPQGTKPLFEQTKDLPSRLAARAASALPQTRELVSKGGMVKGRTEDLPPRLMAARASEIPQRNFTSKIAEPKSTKTLFEKTADLPSRLMAQSVSAAPQTNLKKIGAQTAKLTSSERSGLGVNAASKRTSPFIQQEIADLGLKNVTGELPMGKAGKTAKLSRKDLKEASPEDYADLILREAKGQTGELGGKTGSLNAEERAELKLKTPPLKVVSALRKANLLSSLYAAGKDMLSTGVFSSMKNFVEQSASSVVDKFTPRLAELAKIKLTDDGGQARTGKRSVGDLSAARAKESVKAYFVEGWKHFKQVASGKDKTLLDQALKRYEYEEIYTGESMPSKALDGFINTTIRVRSAVDQFAFQGSLNMAIGERASVFALNSKGTARQYTEKELTGLVKDLLHKKDMLTPDRKIAEQILIDATTDAAEATFNGQNGVSEKFTALKAKGYASEKRGARLAAFVADQVVPFTRVPMNVAIEIVKRLPGVGFARAGNIARRAIKTKTLSQKDQRIFAQAIAEGSIGAAMTGLALYLGDDYLTEPESFNPLSQEGRDIRAKNEAAGRKGGALKVPGLDTWQDDRVLGLPIALMTLVHGLRKEAQRGLNKDESIAEAALGAVGKTVRNVALTTPFARGLLETAQSIGEEGALERTLVKQAVDTVPVLGANIIQDLAPAAAKLMGKESVKRYPERIGRDFVKGVKESVQANVPIWEQGLPAVRDSFGKTVENPVFFKTDKTTPFIRELDRTGGGLGKPKRGEKETPEEYGKRSEALGKIYESNLNLTTKSGAYKSAKPDIQDRMLKLAESRSREGNFIGDPYELRKKAIKSKYEQPGKEIEKKVKAKDLQRRMGVR